MATNYHFWFQIEITHSYFSDGVSGSFHLAPTPETQQRFQQHGIKHKKVDNMFQFFLGIPEGGEVDLAAATRDIWTVAFELASDAIDFFNYTDLPFPQPGVVHLFQNANNTHLLEHTTIPSEATTNNTIGRIELVMQTLTSNQVVLAFKARPVFTQYHFIVHEGAPNNIGDIEITSPIGQTFEGPVDTLLPNATKAKQFTSRTTSLLENRPTANNQLKYTYHNNNSGRQQDKTLALPSPSPQSLIKNEDGAFVANIYVYI